MAGDPAALREAVRRLEAGETGREVDHDIYEALVFDDRFAQPGRFGREPMAFTTSIDAAVTLVPEGCDNSMSWEPGAGINAWASVSWRSGSREGTAPAPAVALALAALRARISMEDADAQ